MPNSFSAPPAHFVGRHDAIGRFRARVEHFNVFIYEGISGIGKTALILRLAQECKSLGATQSLYLTLWPGESMASVLARTEAQLRRGKAVPVDRQVDPYTRLLQVLDHHKSVLVLDDLHHLRREELLALVRAARGKHGVARVIGGIRGDPELSAIDRMEIHLDRVGPLNVDEVKAYAATHKLPSEVLEQLTADALRGGCVGHPLTLRYMLALYGKSLPPKSFLDVQSARSVHAFRALIAEAGDKLDAKDRAALTGLARIGLPLDKALATKLFGNTLASLIKRDMVDVIDGNVYVHDMVAQVLPGELELSASSAKTLARALVERGTQNLEPPYVMRAAEIIARTGDTAGAVDTLAEGWESVSDLGFLEAYLKTAASVSASGPLERRLRLLSARARMRQGNPAAVREEMERLAEDKDPWTRSRALAALVHIYSHINDSKSVIKAFDLLRRTNVDPDVLSTAGGIAAVAMVQVDRVVEAEKLTKQLLTQLRTKKNPRREGDLRRLLARIYSQSGRLEDAVEEARAAVRCFESAGDLYHAAWAQGFIGDLYREVGDFEQAREAFKRFHALAAQWGDRDLLQIAELADAWVSLDIGDLTHASKLISSVEKELTAAPSRRLRRYLLGARSLLEAGRGNHEGAVAIYPQVVEMWDEAGQQNIADMVRAQQVRSLIALGRLEDAEAIVQEALGRLDPQSAAPRVAIFLRESALIRLRRKDVKRAMAELTQARKLLAGGGNRREEALTLYRIAHAALEEGDLGLARERAAEALALARKIKHTRAIALAVELHARLELIDGNAKAAVSHCKEAVQQLRKLGDELGTLHVSETHLRALVVAGDLPGAVRLGLRVSEHAERLEIRDVRIRAIVLTGVALLRKGRVDAALRCFREMKEGSVSPVTLASMWRLGEALASVAGDKALVLQRRERWVQATRAAPEHKQPLILRELEQLSLPPRDRCHLRTAGGDKVIGTEQIAWIQPAEYGFFVDVQNQRVSAGGAPIQLGSPEATALLRELVVASPQPATLEECFTALFSGAPDAKGDKRVLAVLKELEKDLKAVRGLRFVVTKKDVKLLPPKSFAFLIPTALTADLTPQQKKILRLMRRMGTVPIQTVQDEFTLTRAVARRELGQLVADGLVEAVRAGRGQAFRLA